MNAELSNMPEKIELNIGLCVINANSGQHSYGLAQHLRYSLRGGEIK
jgi:hypothetical protein